MTEHSREQNEQPAPRRRLRLAIAIALLVAGATIAHEIVAPPQREWSTRSLVFAIQKYRHHVSPHLKGRVQCRFTTTCSAYGLAAVQKYGAFRGGFRAVNRIARCNPMTPMGTVDEP